jgi:hypothetical protein
MKNKSANKIHNKISGDDARYGVCVCVCMCVCVCVCVRMCSFVCI